MIPGYSAKQAEDMEFLGDKTSRKHIAAPHGDPRVMVPLS